MLADHIIAIVNFTRWPGWLSKGSRFAPTLCWRLVLLGLNLSLIGLLAAAAPAAVPAADITLEPVVTDNLPLISSLTAYVYANDSDAVSIKLGGVTVPYDAPLYYPFDTDTPAWWDNLVAEQLQARLPVVMFASRGAKTTNPAQIDGNMNPRQLTRFVAALQRVNATNLFKIACFIDSPNMQDIYTYIHSLPSGTLLDMSNASDWNDVFWLRGVKPWFDTVPRQYWFVVNGRPVIQWWNISNSWYKNQNGNMSRMLRFLADAFEAAYGVRPGFILHHTWPTLDPGSTNEPDVIGVNNWFSPPNKPYTYNTFNGFTSGTAVPGFSNPSVFDPTSPNYQSAALVIPHNKVDGTGRNGDTLIAGLEAGVAAKSDLTVLEGWNDVREWAGYYRCGNSPRYDFPSQYINLVRRYTDLRTRTLSLEAEGADAYNDTTTGNSGGAWRRFGDLDIRPLSTNGWAVTATAPGEWLEFKQINFSAGNYRFPIRYAASSPRTLRLLINGVPLSDVVLPATGGTNTFDTFNLGSAALAHGVHTLRLCFVDGGVEVDWIFVRKYDPVVTFQSALNGRYLTASWGGNDALVCNWDAAGAWEQFTVDDRASGGSLISGNVVNLQVYNGLYLSANGSSSAVQAKQRTPAGTENFHLVNLNGTGPLTNGSLVAVRTSGGKFITVSPDGSVDASGAVIETGQTFTLRTTQSFFPITPIASTPSGLVANAASGQINLSWKAAPGGMSYNLKRAFHPMGPYALIAANVSGATNFLDVTAYAGTTYYYVVSSVNSGGESSNSVPVAAILPLVVSRDAPVSASSQQSGNEPYKGNDDDAATRWAASGPGFPQWWQVDLGSSRNLTSVAIDWYNSSSRGYGYRIAVSNNGADFTTVVDKSGNLLFGDTADNFSVQGQRYVRVTVTSCTQPGGYASFYECRVYGASASSVNPSRPRIIAVVSGDQLALSWPADHLGWRLEFQTNALLSGGGNNWSPSPGSDQVTSTNIAIDPARGGVLYRLVYP